MSGIYIHIPFCKQACHYCDFHFSTTLSKYDDMIQALVKELQIRAITFANEQVDTIYFGGGTPSILKTKDLEILLNEIRKNYNLADDAEITLEANPDDLSENVIKNLSKLGFNRLSIGIQSFYDEDLKLMNRAHSAKEAKKSLEVATRYFDNISLDLIYAIPGLTDQKWSNNIDAALEFGIPHVSSYALTVEPKTALKKLIQQGLIASPNDEVAANQFKILVEKLENNDFIHYEVSNFGKEGFFSQNNTGYWLGKKYLGIGPSAHSFDGTARSWNISNNSLYIKSIKEGILPRELEILSVTDRYNEYVMTGLRTIWGVSLDKIADDFGEKYLVYIIHAAKKWITDDLLYIQNNILKTSPKAKFLIDGLASDLFYID